MRAPPITAKIAEKVVEWLITRGEPTDPIQLVQNRGWEKRPVGPEDAARIIAEYPHIARDARGGNSGALNALVGRFLSGEEISHVYDAVELKNQIQRRRAHSGETGIEH